MPSIPGLESCLRSKNPRRKGWLTYRPTKREVRENSATQKMDFFQGFFVSFPGYKRHVINVVIYRPSHKRYVSSPPKFKSSTLKNWWLKNKKTLLLGRSICQGLLLLNFRSVILQAFELMIFRTSPFLSVGYVFFLVSCSWLAICSRRVLLLASGGAVSSEEMLVKHHRWRVWGDQPLVWSQMGGEY